MIETTVRAVNGVAALLGTIIPAAAGNVGIARAILPVSAEPNFEPLFYSQMPANVRMVVRMSSKDVTDALLRRYPSAKEDSIRIRLDGEYPIKSQGPVFPPHLHLSR
jgi:hypothetical protein